MSESNISYHLKSNDINECINLLKPTGIKSYIFKPNNGWISFVCEGDDLNNSIIHNNTGVLLYYTFAEDFGFKFSIFQGPNKLCDYSCSWCSSPFNEDSEPLLDDDGNLIFDTCLNIDDKNLNMSELLNLFKDTELSSNINTVLYPEDEITAIEGGISYEFGKLLKLPHIEYTSYQYVENGLILDEDLIRVN